MDALAAGTLVAMAAMLAASVAGPVRLARWRRRAGRRLAPRLAVLRAAVVGQLRRRFPEQPRPAGRPIEDIARDAMRLGRGFRHGPADASFARFEGRRRAYDLVLGEACRALGVDHLLGVMPPGVELDRERQRVELVLDRAGLRLDDAA